VHSKFWKCSFFLMQKVYQLVQLNIGIIFLLQCCISFQVQKMEYRHSNNKGGHCLLSCHTACYTSWICHSATTATGKSPCIPLLLQHF
jgi:hypothetical protein